MHCLTFVSPENVEHAPSIMTSFLMNYTYPGYYTLELAKRGTNVHHAIEKSLVPVNDKLSLSSRLFRNEIKANTKELYPIR